MKAIQVVAVVLLLLAPLQAKAQTITLGVQPGPCALPLHVAVREGLFAAKGLTVTLVPFESAQERDSAVQAGQLDGFAGDMVATLQLMRAGAPMKVVTVACAGAPGQRMSGLITSPRMKGLTIKSLPHHSLGIAHASILDYLLGVMETKNGVSPGALRTIDIARTPMQMQKLLSGEIDTALLPEPLLTLAEKRGGTVLMTDENLGMPLTVLCLKNMLATTPATRTAFLEAYTEALEHIAAAPEHFRPLMVEVCRIPDELAATFPVYAYPPPALPSQEQVLAVQQWMLQRGLLHTQLRYEAITAGP